MGYDGRSSNSKYQQFEWLRQQLAKDGVNLSLPTGN